MGGKKLRYKKIMILTILLVSLLAVSAVSATDDTASDIQSVEETTDEVVSVDENHILRANNNVGTFDELSSLIGNASEGAILELDKDYMYVSGLSEGIHINNTITIDGKGHTLDGNKLSRIFYVNVSGVTLKNITFINGHVEDKNGGAVYWNGANGTLSDCSFVNCSAESNNDHRSYGGAIFWNITDSGNITDCLFENNVAYDGGALYFKGDNGVISGSNFTYNVAYYNGAVLMSSVQGSVVDCIFANNVATDSAGALGWSKKENGSIVGSKFVNNCASIGGAVFLNSGSDFLIMDSIFENNTVSEKGGAVFWDSGNEGGIVGSSFIGNRADGYGGAVFWDSGNEGDISGCLFKNNEAYDGGAIYVEDGNIDVLNSKFISNTANRTGGAIIFNGDELSISGSDFINNAALDDCGAIYVYADKAIISKTKFESNNAPEVGVVCLYCGNALINESYFINNVATDSISIILNAEGNLTVDNCQFIDNSAYSGGTIRNAMFATLILSNSIFESDCLKGRTVDNNYGILYLYNNTIDNLSSEIYNHGGVISSPCTAVVMSSTPFVCGVKTKLIAFIRDDNENLIEEGNYVYFNVNGSLVEAEFNSEISGYKAEYVFNTSGLVEIFTVCPNINITDNQGINSTVIKLDTVISAVYDDANKELIATLKDVDGNVIVGAQVKIILDSVSETLTTDANGQVSLTNVGLVSGNYTADIIFDGNVTYNPSNTTVKVVVNKLNTTLVTKYENGTIYATVTDANGNPVSGLKVGFAVNGVKYVISDENGQANYTIGDLEPGYYSVKVMAYGNDLYETSNQETVVVTKEQAKIYLRNALYFVLQTKMVQVTLWDANNKPIAGKTVYINLDEYGLKYSGVTDKDGNAYIRVGVGFGNHPATVSFEGDDAYSADSKTGRVRVIKETPSLMLPGKYTKFKATDATKTIKVYLKDRYNKPLLPGTKVFVKINGKQYVGQINNEGIASINININQVGVYDVELYYTGNTAYNAVRKTTKISIV